MVSSGFVGGGGGGGGGGVDDFKSWESNLLSRLRHRYFE